MKIQKLNSWKTPATKYPRRKVGSAAVINYYWEKDEFRDAYKVRGLDYIEASKKLKITTLQIDGEDWMVDDPMHWWVIQDFANEYHGNVIVAGLGLGLIVHALAANPKVTKITVVERNKDVITLIKPHVPPCEILHGDWYDFNATGVDGVFYDLFVGDGHRLLSSAISEMLALRRIYPGAVHRILGFSNEMLISLVKFAEEASEKLRKKWGKPLT